MDEAVANDITAGAVEASESNRIASLARKPAGRFDLVSIGLHWLTVLLVVGQFVLAALIDRMPAAGAGLLAAHRLAGMALWLVVVGRLVWRRTGAELPPFPPAMPGWQKAAARANEYALYALLLVQPLTGVGDALFRGRAFALGPFMVPGLLSPDKPVFHALRIVHEWGARALLALIAVHVAAALHHGLVRRDGVLQRMTP
jgi:cytochrome b561